MRASARAGAQVDQHQPLVNAMISAFKKLSIKLFTANREYRTDITLAGQLPDAFLGAYKHQFWLLDATFKGPQAAVHPRNGSATIDGSTGDTSNARTKLVPYIFPLMDTPPHQTGCFCGRKLCAPEADMSWWTSWPRVLRKEHTVAP